TCRIIKSKGDSFPLSTLIALNVWRIMAASSFTSILTLSKFLFRYSVLLFEALWTIVFLSSTFPPECPYETLLLTRSSRATLSFVSNTALVSASTLPQIFSSFDWAIEVVLKREKSEMKSMALVIVLFLWWREALLHGIFPEAELQGTINYL